LIKVCRPLPTGWICRLDDHILDSLVFHRDQASGAGKVAWPYQISSAGPKPLRARPVTRGGRCGRPCGPRVLRGTRPKNQSALQGGVPIARQAIRLTKKPSLGLRTATAPYAFTLAGVGETAIGANVGRDRLRFGALPYRLSRLACDLRRCRLRFHSIGAGAWRSP
jgi:hypothetical protein